MPKRRKVCHYVTVKTRHRKRRYHRKAKSKVYAFLRKERQMAARKYRQYKMQRELKDRPLYAKPEKELTAEQKEKKEKEEMKQEIESEYGA